MSLLKCSKWPASHSPYICTPEKNACSGCSLQGKPSSVIDLLDRDQTVERNGCIEAIRKSIKAGQASLVLGAGVSVPAGMPTWTALISKMLGYAIQYELLERYLLYSSDNSVRNDINSQLPLTKEMISGKIKLLGNVNTLESAEYVSQFFDDLSAERWIREKLPEISVGTMVARMIDSTDTPEALFRKSYHLEKPLTDAAIALGWKEIAKKNTIFAVSYLMAQDSGIRQAVTYNYDPLVQENLLELFGIPKEKILTHPGKWNEEKNNSSDLRQFYHVHGFVYGERHAEKAECQGFHRVFPSESGPLILSEDSYYRIEQEEAYNWSSSIQSYFLNRYNCIFVGFSAEDYNFRRILRQMSSTFNNNEGHDSSNHPWHYLILSVDNWITDTYKAICTAHWSNSKTASIKVQTQIDQEVKLLLQKILTSRAKYWKRFGIQPIWVLREEIPTLLTTLL